MADETSGPEVNIGRLICGGHLPLAVVEKNFQDRLSGFKLKTIQNHDWNDVVRDMRSGKLAGTFILSPLAMNLIRQGLPAKIVLKADRNGNGFVLSRAFTSIAALKQHKSIIAVPHIYSQHHVLLHLALKQHGVPPDMVTALPMPPRDMINALRRGEIDGFVVGDPEANKSIHLGVGWLAAISPQIWKDHIDHVFIAGENFIRQHPEQLQQLVSALVQAGRFIEAQPHQAALMGEDYTGSSAEVFEEVLTTPADWIDYSDMIASHQDIQDMAAHMIEMGLWKDIPGNLASYLNNRFIDQATGKAAE
jgi:NitT/TauT family transport system substrate-binding protein